MKVFANVLLLVAASVVSLLSVELAYRYYLRHELRAAVEPKVQDLGERQFKVFAYPAPWRFSKDLGYQYNDGTWRTAAISEGAFSECGVGGAGNKYGNVGKVVGDYHSADLKILIIGSSYTQVATEEGDLVSHLLQRHLSEQTGSQVGVLNFSRDATGILNSFDIAAATLDSFQPDLILFVFNYTALRYQRYWRTLVPFQEGLWRMAFVLDPEANPTDRKRTFLMTQLISEEIDEAWCTEMERALSAGAKDRLREDPVAKRLLAAFHQIEREKIAPEYAVDFLTSDYSFVYNSVFHGDPYFGIEIFQPRSLWGPNSYQSLAEDERFVRAVDRVKASGVPFLLIHVPTLKEIRASPDGGYLFATQGDSGKRMQGLSDSLEQLTGKPTIHAYAYYDAEAKADPLGLVYSEKDSHPSPKGVRAMARALTSILFSFPETRSSLSSLGGDRNLE